MRMRASAARRRATSTSCRSATDSDPANRDPSSVSSPTSSRYGRAARTSRRRLHAPRYLPAPRKTFSAADSVGTRLSSCCTTAIPFARDWPAPCSATCSPLISIVPASGVTRPARTFTSVLFPAPFSPSSAITSLEPSSKSAFDSASTSPYRFVIPAIRRRTGSVRLAGAGAPVSRSPSITGSGRPWELEEHHFAAGEVEGGAGRELRVVRGDEGHHRSHVLGRSHPPERDRLRFLAHQLVAVPAHARGALPEADVHHVGHHRPGADAVDGDAVLRELEGENLGDPDDRELRRGVDAPAGPGVAAGLRGRVDDPASALLAHDPAAGAGAGDHPLDVDREHTVDDLVGRVDHVRDRLCDARVVREDVERAVLAR